MGIELQSASSSGGGSGGNVTITGPVDGSGNVKVAQQGDVGLAAGANLIGQVEQSDGTNVIGTATHPTRVDPTGTTTQPVSGTFWQATQPVSVSNQPGVQGLAPNGSAVAGNPVLLAGSDGTDARTLSTNASGEINVANFPTTQPVSGTVTADPPAPTPVAGQTAVGTSAVQLPANALTRQEAVVKNPTGATGVVYVGFSSGVTTANGFSLAAGEAVPLAVSNTNQIWVIASAASQVVGWVAS